MQFQKKILVPSSNKYKQKRSTDFRIHDNDDDDCEMMMKNASEGSQPNERPTDCPTTMKTTTAKMLLADIYLLDDYYEHLSNDRDIQLRYFKTSDCTAQTTEIFFVDAIFLIE